MSNPFTTKDPLFDIINQVMLGEKKLTDAELKKREEIAKAMERDNPGMDMGKKMAIATATAKKVAEEAEQIDEVGNTLKGQIGLRDYKEKAKKDMGDAGEKLWYKSFSDKDTKGKIALIRQRDKRRKGIQRADARIKFEEVNLDEQLENFWEAYTTMFNEAEDKQQNILLRAMAKDPTDLMKMKRAIKMGDKALTNPALRQEILKMLDQMMTLTTGDKSLLQRTRMGFQKAKTMKMPEEVQLEEGFTHYRYSGHVNGKDYEVHIPRKHDLGDYSDHQLHKKLSRENPHLHHHEVTAVVHSGGEENSHVEVEHKGKKYKHHVYNEQEPDYVYEEVQLEEVEELDERNKENAMRRKMMDASRGARYKLANKAVPNPEPEHKTAQAHNKAIGRALRNEAIGAKDKQDEGEYGYEGDMAMSQLRTIIRNCQEMMKVLDKETDMPEWVQSKITLATDYLQTANDYLMSELEEEAEIDEGKVYDPITKKMVATKSSKVKAGGGVTIDGVPVDMSKYKSKKPKNEEVELGEADEKEVGKEVKAARLKKDSSDFMSKSSLFSGGARDVAKHLGKKDDEKYGEAMKKVKDTPVSKFVASRKGDGKVHTEEAEKAPFEGGRPVKSKKSAAERVKKIAKGMQKQYTKDKK